MWPLPWCIVQDPPPDIGPPEQGPSFITRELFKFVHFRTPCQIHQSTPLLVTSGDRHWRPVPTCLLQKLPLTKTSADIWWLLKHVWWGLAGDTHPTLVAFLFGQLLPKNQIQFKKEETSVLASSVVFGWFVSKGLDKRWGTYAVIYGLGIQFKV